ncbi:hypothetical protein PR048_012085 [Dryococelus australis]|uniref:Uncharacterized protein n=1 Tax=Dryococelus australis TaxID=614101 RepID=A0ABQ9HP06_9NEOP|nr:hypothetical protein PR048_012085 [Dryococelus australis]
MPKIVYISTSRGAVSWMRHQSGVREALGSNPGQGMGPLSGRDGKCDSVWVFVGEVHDCEARLNARAGVCDVAGLTAQLARGNKMAAGDVGFCVCGDVAPWDDREFEPRSLKGQATSGHCDTSGIAAQKFTSLSGTQTDVGVRTTLISHDERGKRVNQPTSRGAVGWCRSGVRKVLGSNPRQRMDYKSVYKTANSRRNTVVNVQSLNTSITVRHAGSLPAASGDHHLDDANSRASYGEASCNSWEWAASSGTAHAVGAVSARHLVSHVWMAVAKENSRRHCLGGGGIVVRLLAPNLGELGSIPGGVAPYLRMWESCQTMTLVGEFSRGYSASSAFSFRRCSIPTSPYQHRLSSPSCREPPKYFRSTQMAWRIL